MLTRHAILVEGEIAGVKAYCSGDESNDLFRSCRLLEGVNNGVAAKFGPRNASAPELGPKEIAISFELGAYEPTQRYVEFPSRGMWMRANTMSRPAYNFTGYADAVYNAFVSPNLDFDVQPSEVFAVA